MSEVERDIVGIIPYGYAELLNTLKDRIRTSQTNAVFAANRELVRLYWEIGRQIVARQQVEGWGASVIQRLATDLQREVPGMAGFSPRNIWRMRALLIERRSSFAISLNFSKISLGISLIVMLTMLRLHPGSA